MTQWAARRFWKSARATLAEGGHAVLLDDRPLRTPAKALLLLPSEALAQAVAAEWDAQEGLLRPAAMPLTRAANAAIDKVTPQRAEVVDALAAYGGSDLICYRADAPAALAARQAASWDPLIAWSAEVLQAPLAVTTGLMPCPQPPESLATLHRRVAALDPFALTALSELVALSGSLVIGLAALERRMPAETLWQASRIDETWQEELWGEDAEAAEAAAARRADFHAALRFHRLCTAA